MVLNAEYYHGPQEAGYWAMRGLLKKDILLKNGQLLKNVIPQAIWESGNELMLTLATDEKSIDKPLRSLMGLEVVKGDSGEHPFETDGELLVQFNYLKIDTLEARPRRIRPAGIKFGIYGEADREAYERGEHRAMGEDPDYYLEGTDTQYDPAKSPNGGFRIFPFWRMGVWGDQLAMAKKFIPPTLNT